MNIVDYLLDGRANSEKDFILNPSEKISFKELTRRVASLTEGFYCHVGTGQKIILIGKNSTEFIIAYLATMKSGNVCVPLDPQIKQSELDYIVEQVKSVTIFIFGKTKLKAKSYPYRSTPPEDKDLAQILFTSGSTGRPKGVKLSHQNLIANTKAIIHSLRLTQEDVMCATLPFHYCYGLSVLHTHLRVGASMVLNNSFVFFGKLISDLLEYECTGLAGVPSHFQMLLRKSTSFSKTSFPALRYITQAGGKLFDGCIVELKGYFPDALIYIMYGQTEATARLTCLAPGSLLAKLGSVGKPLQGVRIKIEREEILAKGESIMMGYLNEPPLEGGWLHTGDLGYLDNEGFLYITGRKKEMIKVLGKRVSPKEIEEVILKVDPVIDCQVKGAPDEITGEAVKAFVIIDNNKSDEYTCKKNILAACKVFLPDYKIPSQIEFVNKLNKK
ncbi:MAG: AMP-dependent synthetase [Bacteroidetes bacterium]|nr:MAG: AMP-dependent synthetase [Bacteroidota bacterium]